MTRARRSRFLQQLSDQALTSELKAHVDRLATTSVELKAHLASLGMTWERAAIVLMELAGHVGRGVAICREGAKRKLVRRMEELEETKEAAEGAA